LDFCLKYRLSVKKFSTSEFWEKCRISWKKFLKWKCFGIFIIGCFYRLFGNLKLKFLVFRNIHFSENLATKNPEILTQKFWQFYLNLQIKNLTFCFSIWDPSQFPKKCGKNIHFLTWFLVKSFPFLLDNFKG